MRFKIKFNSILQNVNINFNPLKNRYDKEYSKIKQDKINFPIAIFFIQQFYTGIIKKRESMRIYSTSQTNSYNNRKSQNQKFGVLTTEAIKIAHKIINGDFATKNHASELNKLSWLEQIRKRAANNTKVDVQIYPTGGPTWHIGLQRPGQKYIQNAEQKDWGPKDKESFLATLERFVGLAEKEAGDT